MQVVRANCRERFTLQDFEFLIQAVAPEGNQEKFLLEVLQDKECRDIVLDEPQLLRSLLEQRGNLRISLHFYFYVLVRHMFRSCGIEDRELADYVADLLSQFTMTQRMRRPVAGKAPMDYLVDMILAIRESQPPEDFRLQAHMGNYSLFLSGVFRSYIEARALRKIAPDLEYYESMGKAGYKLAANHRMAEQLELAEVLAELSRSFQEVRSALNDLTTNWLHLHRDQGIEALVRSIEEPGSNQ